MPDDPTPPAASRPTPARTPTPRLPGTYAANYESSDPSWRRGVTVLWIIFVLAAICEAVNAAWFLLSGHGSNLGPLDVPRLILEGALFLALWMGWRWLRWPLAVMNFLYGGWLVVWLIALHSAEAADRVAAGESAPGYGAGSIPVLATALVYLFSAGYLAFSADVVDFLRHRREEGRGWVVAPLTALVGGYLGMIFGAAFIYAAWIGLEAKTGGDFILQSLHAMSSPWDATVYENVAAAEYLNTWYQGDRKDTFGKLSPLGAFKQYGHRYVTGTTGVDEAHGAFLVTARCDLESAQFAHGHARFSAVATKRLFGSWKMEAFQMNDIQMDDGSFVAPH